MEKKGLGQEESGSSIFCHHLRDEKEFLSSGSLREAGEKTNTGNGTKGKVREEATSRQGGDSNKF